LKTWRKPPKNIKTSLIFMNSNQFVPLNHDIRTNEELLKSSEHFRKLMESRRSVRTYSDEDVPKEVIENIIMTASSAPSGAHKQPWTFCVVSNPDIKKKIREAAEKEEYENYHGRMSDEWLKDLEKFDTNWQKEFLTTAPYIIVMFKKAYNLDELGVKHKNYYVSESVGIAAGLLIAAIHMAGLVTLTHTPSPMNFLQEILCRPENERPFLLLPVGYPAKETVVPYLIRKTQDEVSLWY
jgi:iodotyrosine deiodinase